MTDRKARQPAAPNMAPATAPFLAPWASSALARANSARTISEMSAVASATNWPSVRSSSIPPPLSPRTTVRRAEPTGSGGFCTRRSGSSNSLGLDHDPRGSVGVGGGGGGQALGDQVHHRGVGQRGLVADLALLRDVAQ